jgi:hypothetical protein
MKRKQVISGTILFVLALVSICTAKVITVIPSKDNTLYQNDQGSISNGAGVGLFVGHNKSDTFIRRALLAFDFSSHIPPGSTIHSVNLTLHLSRTSSGTQYDLIFKIFVFLQKFEVWCFHQSSNLTSVETFWCPSVLSPQLRNPAETGWPGESSIPFCFSI